MCRPDRTQDCRLWVRLREKGGKRHEMPCHHNLESYLHAYVEGTGIAADPKGPLFRTISRVTGRLTRTPLPQANARVPLRGVPLRDASIKRALRWPRQSSLSRRQHRA